MNILIFFVAVLVFNFIYNYYKYLSCKKYIEWYEKWCVYPDFDVNLVEHKSVVKSLVENAGIKNTKIPYEQMGISSKQYMLIDFLDQFPAREKSIAFPILRAIAEAKGVYKKRMGSSYNPLAWFEFAIYFPSKILKFIGSREESAILKILNFVWWIVGVIIIPILIATYTSELSIFIRSVFEKISEFY
ncbi:hypothetical protein [Bacillus altitudinis]|uniref:hypothetical protein n=1 Tax=Bacillus altitudinis TaxID=293387 RepID=UPI0011A498EB|nr:hypothetical protein [Bacillus altitudinis]